MTALFGSTSPSYLVMESLDKVNGRLLSDPDSVNRACASVAGLKQRLTALGFTLKISDPLRVTINARAWGWSGTEFAAFLRAHGAECEMADENYVVLLFSAITSRTTASARKSRWSLSPPNSKATRGISGYPSEAGNQHSRSVFAKTAQRFRRRSKREGLRRNSGLMPARNSDSNARRAYRQRSRRGSEALRREIRRDPRLIHAGFSGGKIRRTSSYGTFRRRYCFLPALHSVMSHIPENR